MNIFSGSMGLGAALTNPTTIAYRKRTLTQHYPVVFCGVHYADAEAAYQAIKIPGNIAFNDLLMTWIVASKLLQHPRLLSEVKRRGGSDFLLQCSHFTNAKTRSAQSWEGQGMESRFIRNLLGGYELAQSGNPIPGNQGYVDIYATAGVAAPEQSDD